MKILVHQIAHIFQQQKSFEQKELLPNRLPDNQDLEHTTVSKNQVTHGLHLSEITRNLFPGTTIGGSIQVIVAAADHVFHQEEEVEDEAEDEAEVVLHLEVVVEIMGYRMPV